MDKLKMETSDMAAENIEKIGALFPSAVTEMRGEDGSIKKGVNFEMLKQLLSPDVVEEGDERYEFTWVGKKQAIAEAARPTTKTLRPVKEDSRNWDATENLYIEGDNLEVLKILQESYLGKVKMIYIDPPYNTGHDFIYRDDFGMSREEWSEKSGELSEDGDRLFENTESNGRFHSDWCSMTYSRLMLARNLLTEDGVVFISLDDGEIENLREICNEVFGEQNFLAQCVRKRRDSQANLSKNISPIHEYVVLYAKSNGNLHYLDGIDVHKTHQGYFSIDKKKGKKARFVEGKIDRKTQLSDDVDAYDLIMKDKERLLSLDEPVRFIFSHSALREGWDNPNVFQICTLKPQSESEIRSRQEIGRGLRLCVNQQGERMDESVLGRDVQELNKLTLITDLEYGKFAEALQTGLAESLADRPQKVDTQLFVGRTLVDANGEQVHVTQDLANAIYEDLIQNDYVKRGKLTDKYFADKEIGSFHVASEVSGYADSVVRILSGVYDAHTMAPENAHSNNVQAIVDEEKLHKAEFLNLWNRINHKSFYTVQFDTPELIDHSIRALDSKLNVTRVQINLEYGEQTARLESREQLEQGKGFQKARSDRESAKYAPLGSVRYDLVGKLVEETGLTRATVAAILRGIAPQTFSQFRINPEEFILKAARLINDEKATQIIEHITYNRLDAAYDQDVFTRATLRGKLDVNAMEANRSLYSHVIYDSDNERRFAQELDVSDQVAVYVKLPGSFYISTPVGKYNPDWAIAFNEGSVKHIYFVAETKGNLDTMELRGVENAKIECAKKHFAAISNGSVVYSVVDNYSTLMQLVSN